MHFCFEQTVPLAPPKVFAFFENPGRLELLHPGWPKLRLLHHETQIRVGGETWIEVTVAGFVPVVFGFRHVLFEPPLRFGEESIHGPFSRFIHIHEFRLEDGKTVVRDLLEVCLPRYYGGRTIMRHGVAAAIRRVFDDRTKALAWLIEDGTVARCSSASACV